MSEKPAELLYKTLVADVSPEGDVRFDNWAEFYLKEGHQEIFVRSTVSNHEGGYSDVVATFPATPGLVQLLRSYAVMQKNDLYDVRAHPEYRRMYHNLSEVQERCTRQEQEIRDLKAAVFNLTSARSAIVEELEEMTEQYEEARDLADRLQDELLEKGSE